MTPETLTDEMVRAELDAYRRRGDSKWMRVCAAALVPDGRRVVAVWLDARQRICDAINAAARSEK